MHSSNPAKAILAANESLPTIERRFRTIGGFLDGRWSARLSRDAVHGPGLGEFISAVILFDETLRMKTTTKRSPKIQSVPTVSAELLAQIAAHPFLKGLSEDQIAVVAEFAMETEFKPGKQIFSEGDVADRFYLILDGKVALEAQRKGKVPLMIEIIRGGGVLGWSWMFEPYTWHFGARAMERTKAIFFYGTWLREWCEQDHDLGWELARRMAKLSIHRLEAVRDRFNLSISNQRPG